MGYEDKIIDIDGNGSTMDALICYMKKKTIDLDEVVVTALKPKISIKNNSYILSVDKTYLSNEAMHRFRFRHIQAHRLQDSEKDDQPRKS